MISQPEAWGHFRSIFLFFVCCLQYYICYLFTTTLLLTCTGLPVLFRSADQAINAFCISNYSTIHGMSNVHWTQQVDKFQVCVCNEDVRFLLLINKVFVFRYSGLCSCCLVLILHFDTLCWWNFIIMSTIGWYNIVLCFSTLWSSFFHGHFAFICTHTHFENDFAFHYADKNQLQSLLRKKFLNKKKIQNILMYVWSNVSAICTLRYTM